MAHRVTSQERRKYRAREAYRPLLKKPDARKPVPVNKTHDIVDIRTETATVESESLGRIVGEVDNGVLAAQLDGVKPEPPRGDLDQSLGNEIRLGLAGATIRIDRRSVRKDPPRFRVDRRHGVTTADRR